jgi:hypothetical protein
MITKTIGTGGDYAELKTAWASIPFNVLDDYTFNIISDITATGGIGSWDRKDFSGHIIIIQDLGHIYKITTTYEFLFYSNSTNSASTIILDGLTFDYTGAGNFLGASAWAHGSDVIKMRYKNLTLIGHGGGYGIRNYSDGVIDEYIFNCRIINYDCGIEWGGASIALNTPHIIENCVVYGCVTSGINLFTSDATHFYTLKNTVAAGNPIDFNPLGAGTGSSITNCASKDTTVNVLGATNTANITGVVSADFLSIASLNVNFLKIDQSSRLYETGSVSLSSWNTIDLFGNPRPHGTHNLVSIGVHEGIYSVPSGDYYVVSNSVVILKGLIQSWSQKSSGRIPIMDVINAHTANRNNPHQVKLSQLYPGALSVYANNAAAIAGGLIVGQIYRTGGDPDTICVVH